MNILILNGDPESGNSIFDRYIKNYQMKLHHLDYYAKTFYLRELSLPVNGSSVLPESNSNFGDATRYILNSLKETDLLVMASPLRQGHVSALMRFVQSRIASHFQMVNARDINRPQAAANMQTVPLMGVILHPEPDTTQQELLLNKLTQERIAADMHTLVSFQITTESTVTDAVCNTISGFDRKSFVERSLVENLLQ